MVGTCKLKSGKARGSAGVRGFRLRAVVLDALSSFLDHAPASFRLTTYTQSAYVLRSRREPGLHWS